MEQFTPNTVDRSITSHNPQKHLNRYNAGRSQIRNKFHQNKVASKRFARLKGTVRLDPPKLRRGFSHDEARHRQRGACRRGSPPAPPVRRTRLTEGYRRFSEGSPKPPKNPRRQPEAAEGYRRHLEDGPKPPKDRRRVHEVLRRRPKLPKPPKGTMHAPKAA